MANVHANPDDLRRFARELRTTRSEIETLTSRLSKTLASLDWKDQVRSKIEDDVRQLTSGLNKFSARLDDHAKQVDRKASDLDRYTG